MSGPGARKGLAELTGSRPVPQGGTPPAQVTLARTRASIAADRAQDAERARRLGSAMERLAKTRRDFESWKEETDRRLDQWRTEMDGPRLATMK